MEEKTLIENGNVIDGTGSNIKKESIQFTISFWINIKLISDDDRNIFVIKKYI